jgi:hypothetical protein
VIVDVTEGRRGARQFEVTAKGWQKVRDRLTPGPGVRIVFYPLEYL